MQTLKLTICLTVFALAGLGEALSQESWQRANSTVADDQERRIQDIRERGEQIRQRLADEHQEQQERIQRERREAREKREAEVRANVQRMRSSYGTYPVARVTPSPRRSYYSYGYSPDDSEQDEHRSAWAPGVDDRRSPAGRTEQERASQQEDDDEHRSAWALGVDDRRSPAGQDEQERASQQDDSFAAASGKCGDITTQRIGNFYYHSDGGVTQKVGNFLYGPDGEVTQKIGNFYHHSDGTTTQRIGNFYYDSDGGVTQKIGSFYYHSGGKPCEDGENE